MRSRIKDGVTQHFQEKTGGKITGVKLRETDQGPTEYLVSLWSSDGVLLSSENTGKDLVDGWHVVTFPEPVPTIAEAHYTVVYWASPKNTQHRAARGDDVVVQWTSDEPTATPTPTATTSATPTPSKSTSDSSSGSGGAPTSDIPLLPSYPDASNTGVPSGTSFKTHSGDWTITKAGTVIDGYDVKGIILVRANNVVIKNSRIRGVGWWSIDVKDGLTGVVVQDCDIDGQGTSGREGSMGIMGPAKVLRNDIRGVENGLTPGSGSLLQDNYVHDLGAGGSDPHYDGIQIDGDRDNITILHNTVINQYHQTAAVMIDNGFGPINNITVKNNYLGGGGYTVYSDGQFSGGPISGVKFLDNTFRRGYWGYASFENNSPVVSGNTDAETGKTISLTN
jgi:pectate lyase